MAETSYRDLQRIADTHECSECGGRLTVAYLEGQLRIRCGNDKTHQGHRYIPSYMEQYKRGEDVPLVVAERLRKRIGGEPMESRALTTMDEKTMLQRIEAARFPKALNPEEKRTLALAAISYGFDPLMGELTIYQGRPYVSVDGRYRKAHEEKMPDGQPVLDGLNTRPATKQEREDWSIPEDDYFFRAEVWRKDASHPFVGWGRVRASEAKAKDGYLPLETNPQRMAEKRAEVQALRKAFFLPLPSLEEPGDESASIPPAPPQARKSPDPPQTTARPSKPPPVASGGTLGQGPGDGPVNPALAGLVAGGQKAQEGRMASPEQRNAIAKLQARLGDPENIPGNLTDAAAQEVIRHLNQRLRDKADGVR